MNEQKRDRIILWQTLAEDYPPGFMRYTAALEMFGDDEEFIVWPDGSVGFSKPISDSSPTFGDDDEYLVRLDLSTHHQPRHTDRK